MQTESSIVSPVDQSVYKTVRLSTREEAMAAVNKAHAAQAAWKATSLENRIALVTKFVEHFVGMQDDICLELTWLIGRPLQQNKNEVRGFEERARHLLSIAKESLVDTPLVKQGFNRFIRREPLGVIFSIAAWNYPYLIAVNVVVPALLSGNTVLLKQAPQTFPCGERFAQAFAMAGLPAGVFQNLCMDHAVAEAVIQNPLVNHVQFTGSVRGGREVNRAAADRFITVGLELGGNDPAFVRSDADLLSAAESLVDGAMYNSGQSCCGVERIYVHKDVYQAFVDKVVEITKQYVLGNPMKEGVNLGPVISIQAAKAIREHVADAVAKGAKNLIPESCFSAAKEKTPYVAPQILVDVDHTMRIMTEETFGPVVGIMKVSSDEEAIRLMNDSDFGLTASIWTKDVNAAMQIGDALQTGTVFLNRCDYLDPALPWIGVKDSGRGCSLSTLGFDQLTRPKSFHFRLPA
ncbi:hypothetical protein BATDEDRAFT_91630 [Batrachochytrium dendrobatidis JAM81]|uniref:Aldehyde dehydrogenase domain-containing protein n=1 Tax=Batrachochytrium dendrobatidis (strain JAM81 / FGSC 10211) TaxID=684364 RepID=F4PB87_BATDJ|nr:uncharacterized protein BATDEDRAFT_91630 [Batrachochytrium dendrobatidis JAM81]EGF77282.1 hypothetical protein BATDEDRAFT_91630 [Batrachochytrium dendrobatidis JAM81]KAJ8327758.1 hypothetical protein O5D80_004093 [Batrachochytrium dendrobatidis]KAK5669388.1 hypothetical protein QVD99_003784 [Batrachochytrium dendrobatidis]|eukprot:XP_006682029.1 hypothetical protein BATDEDRAFT_91630 [Batrachochytrium dendrobatidis JAM81]